MSVVVAAGALPVTGPTLLDVVTNFLHEHKQLQSCCILKFIEIPFPITLSSLMWARGELALWSCWLVGVLVG